MATRTRTAAQARELLAQATVLAVVMWSIALYDATSPSSRGRLSGLPIGTDFINFYTLAHVGATARYDALASVELFHAEQQRVLPDSGATLYPPVYPPQVALLLSPLARLSYWHAYVTWLGCSVLAYLGTVWLMSRHCPRLQAWPAQVFAVAVANPALWFVAMHGQVSTLALLAIAGAWWALRAERPWLAGFALGILAFKPSLFVPALTLCLVAREWRLAGGAIAGAIGQFGIAMYWTGALVVEQYAGNTIELLRTPDVVASNAPMMHSLRTFWTSLLPSPLATGFYVVSAGAVLLMAATAWRRMPDPLDRVAVLSAAVVLTSPHLFAYDLLILTPLLLASAERVLEIEANRLKALTYLSFVAPIWSIPIATLGLQASTLVLTAWLVVFSRTTCAQTAPVPRS